MMSHFEPRLDSLERERILFDAIKESPQLHHNALLKTIVPMFMAKNTFEKTRDSLLQKGLISTVLKGNMKYYSPTSNYTTKALQNFEKITQNSFHDLKMSVKKLVIDYSHKDVDQKINQVSSLLTTLLKTDTGFTILDSVKNPKKTLYRDEHLEIQQLISDILETVNKDKDFESIHPTVIACIGDLLPKV